MRYRSTRDHSLQASLSEAIDRGLAPDGGLYVPTSFPSRTVDEFDGQVSLPEVARILLAPLCESDALAPFLPRICAEALDFPVPLRSLDPRTRLLELFHGPTAAFKDVGARFLAACMRHSPARGAGTQTILVATSGDTGSAIAAAFDGEPGVEVVILYPRGRVSPRQEHQLCCWSDNVRTFRVDGSFDDCQRMVKSAFADESWRAERRLTSANSINIGRLLPQAAYHALISVHSAREGRAPPAVIVPSGNVGNACAALWVKAMGLPLGRVHLAANANRAVPDYFADGHWAPRDSIVTLASAMDVGDPSNMERVLDLFSTPEALREVARSSSCDDATMRRVIAESESRWGTVVCPHTAVALHEREGHPGGEAVLVATAHPAKFEAVVEPLIGRELEVPPSLAELLARPTRREDLAPRLEDLQAALAGE